MDTTQNTLFMLAEAIATGEDRSAFLVAVVEDALEDIVRERLEEFIEDVVRKRLEEQSGRPRSRGSCPETARTHADTAGAVAALVETAMIAQRAIDLRIAAQAGDDGLDCAYG